MNRRHAGVERCVPGALRGLFAVLVFVLFAGIENAAAQDLVSPTAGPRPPAQVGKPTERALQSAGSTSLDLRNIPRQKPRIRMRPEREPPPVHPVELPGYSGPAPAPRTAAVTGPSAPAPAPMDNFAGLDFADWGSGWPPDTVGDVGPTHYIQMVNSSVGIYDKSTGTRLAAFLLDSFFSLGSYGNLCDTDNFGDPVVLYDSFEDRWVISDFAFQLDNQQNVVNPPGAFECIAVSKSGDPVAGGWNFYYLNFTDGLNDYPKLGIWPDGIYMAANMFDFAASGSFQNSRVWALNKQQMYAGDASVQVVQFDAPAERIHAPAGQRPPADGHAACRRAQLFRRGLELQQRNLRLQVPRRLGQHFVVDFHRPIHQHRAGELERRARHGAGTGRA